MLSLLPKSPLACPAHLRALPGVRDSIPLIELPDAGGVLAR
jgi:hypothetical protein